MIIVEKNMRKLLGTGNALFYSIIKNHSFKVTQDEVVAEYGLSVQFQLSKEQFFINANIVSARSKTLFKVDEKALNYVLYLYSVAGYCADEFSGNNFEITKTMNYLLSVIDGEIKEQVESKPEAPKTKNNDVEEIINLWNEKLSSIGEITQKNKTIRAKIKTRIKSLGIENVKKVLLKLEKDKYLHSESWMNSSFVFRSDNSIEKINSEWMKWKRDGSNFNEANIDSEMDEFESLMND